MEPGARQGARAHPSSSSLPAELNDQLSAALAAAEPPPDSSVAPFALVALDGSILAAGVALLAVAGVMATLRIALRQAHKQRVLERTRSDEQRARLEPLLERADSLATSASILSITARLGFVGALFLLISDGERPDAWDLLTTLGLAVPVFWLATEGLPVALAKRFGDTWLIHGLPIFRVVQLPIAFVTHTLEGLRRAFLRMIGLQDSTPVERQIVEGLRDVIVEAEMDEDLDETEREIIGNVLDFSDVDVAAVMTPRTEVVGVEVDATLLEAARAISSSGFSRIPAYDGNLDTIVGTFSARDLVHLVATGELDKRPLRDILRPAYFVPETKEVSELLAELRRDKTKMAIVLDEYGGTAGLVTLTDILEEIVGDIPDEFDADEPHPIHRLPDGRIEIEAGLHVSEVNEELDLDLPEEEDFETLAGFVLARFGRFPKPGEAFEFAGRQFLVLDANDRRVLRVEVRGVVAEKSA